jgi:hypothetical protein
MPPWPLRFVLGAYISIAADAVLSGVGALHDHMIFVFVVFDVAVDLLAQRQAFVDTYELVFCEAHATEFLLGR